MVARDVVVVPDEEEEVEVEVGVVSARVEPGVEVPGAGAEAVGGDVCVGSQSAFAVSCPPSVPGLCYGDAGTGDPCLPDDVCPRAPFGLPSTVRRVVSSKSNESCPLPPAPESLFFVW